MNNRRDIRLYLDDILEALEKIERYTVNFTEDDFLNDEKTMDAVIKNFAVLGEAVKHLPLNFRIKYPHIPWRSIAGMHDKLIHEYFGIRYDVVWKPVTTRISKLKIQVQEILNQRDR